MTQVLWVLGGFGAAVTLLYLLKLRRRQVEVPFVYLWHQVLAEKQTNRLFSALKRILSWLLALAVIALLALALGDPRVPSVREDARTTVVLIDVSASMQATDVSPDRLHAARAHVRRLIEGLGGQDRMLIATMEQATVPISPLSSETRVLTDALDRVGPTDLEADLNRGLRFSLDVLRGQPRPRVVIVSDGVFDEAAPAPTPADGGAGETGDGPPEGSAVPADPGSGALGPRDEIVAQLRDAQVEVNWQPIGAGGDNIAITAFSVRRYPLDVSRSEVLVELWNPGAGDLSVELELLGDGQAIDVQRLRVAGGERLRRFFTDVSGADQTLEARVRLVDGHTDLQPADDRAFARLPQRRRARILAITRGNLYLSAALLLDEYLDVVEATPERYAALAAGQQGEFDVTIFDSWVPPTPPQTSTIYLHPVPPEGAQGPFEITGLAARPYFDRVDHDHPLVQFTALSDVNIAEALEVQLAEGDRVVGGDRGTPLLVTGTRNAHHIVALLFDVRRSDLPLRAAWPLLLLNSINFFGDEEAGYLSSYETGETWHVPVAPGAARATLISPYGREREVPVVDGRAICTGDRAGFYRVVADGEQQLVAANLGPSREAIISPRERLEFSGVAVSPPEIGTPGVRRELWMLLVGLVLAIVVIEWLTFHRRVTV